MSEDNAIWKPVPDLPVEASSDGRVRRARDGYEYAVSVNSHGYRWIKFKSGGQLYCCRVGRLVCAAFHGEPRDDDEADHINRIRGDDRADNLRWLPREQNRAQRVHPKGEAHWCATLTDSDVVAIRAISGVRYRDIAKAFGVSLTTIKRIRSGRAWAHIPVSTAAKGRPAANNCRAGGL